ncbi:PRC-barrel domain-containing protein [Sphingomonas laterariae]|uniref:PRC-barrel domain-containing protein n=1 Tax=Edaphosphingomonas laterariae TaxID=861865 RepID=A0A239HCT1_9SPHN|nr:PRC-barrel domain-containing protein [Sphingomonas laterariae]SNS78828.1 PRC-barrel domain-containing protein [Sphingomonas laterariae]
MTDMTTAMDQSHELISSARVEGTPVYSPQGDKLGTIHAVMIHKTTGQVAYAVLQFGGLFGIGSHVHPLPWDKITYDAGRHGYVADVTREQIEDAPSLDLDATDRIRESETPMYSYWDSKPYW